VLTQSLNFGWVDFGEFILGKFSPYHWFNPLDQEGIWMELIYDPHYGENKRTILLVWWKFYVCPLNPTSLAL
jgi:hypothetical protein